MDETIALTQLLIACPSVTPDDAGCQEIISQRLHDLGFTITPLPFGEVKNLWARIGTESPLVVFAGHTDVVPPGNLDSWSSPPFNPEIRDGNLYGRGAVDMKGSIAAMITAVSRFLKQHPDHKGSIGFLITSDEEGPSIDGTAKVVEYLKTQQVKIDSCIVGEPSCETQLGDTLKIGRRGSLSATLTIKGIQGHVAYPERIINPIHQALPAILELINHSWAEGNVDFPPTSMQISNINAGTGASNVTPEELKLNFNFRYNPLNTAEEIIKTTEEVLEKHRVNYEIKWHHSGKPFITDRNSSLVEITSAAIHEVTGITPKLLTNGGTSDGRFIATLGCELIELGPINKTIHQVDEHVNVTDLILLSTIYEKILRRLL